ncbi:MAG: 50S ribosomal protein L15 [Calditrichaeota bacterium]|nr:MAG: 50S ribosomal protein L15 [Calditrichota bacterium]
MDLSNLKYADGSIKKRKRIGRGDASGSGGTAGKGHKGAKARSGAKHRAWFEGGQMPLNRRLPKFGFTNIFKKEWQIVNVSDLEKIEGDKVDPTILEANGLIRSSKKLVKILGDGELTKALEITANAFSKSAEEKINAAGGKATKL